MVNRYTATDGRRIEQHVVETQHEKHKERVVETHIEQVPYALEERVTEKIVPIVTERRKEKFNHGELVDTEVEQVADESLHLNPPGPKVVTKADVEEAVRNVLATVPVKSGIAKEVKVKKQKTIVAPPSNMEWIDIGLYMILSGELAFIVYQLFLKGVNFG
jgi:ATP-dependent protease HslVU (ClpYQ) ATPase subunit